MELSRPVKTCWDLDAGEHFRLPFEILPQSGGHGFGAPAGELGVLGDGLLQGGLVLAALDVAQALVWGREGSKYVI